MPAAAAWSAADADRIHELVRKMQANEPVPPGQRRLTSPGVTMGGVRRKGLLDIEGDPYRPARSR